MSIAKTLIDYLDSRNIDYYTVDHRHSQTARGSAKYAHLPPHQIAKAVVLRDNDQFIVTVIPANRTLELDWVNEVLERNFRLATERELQELFWDCETGAVPAISGAYGLQVVWDDQLAYTNDIFIEAGDHEHLICLERKDFRGLMSTLPHSIISKGCEFEHWKH